jgi:hypothetical protein
VAGLLQLVRDVDGEEPCETPARQDDGSAGVSFSNLMNHHGSLTTSLLQLKSLRYS